MSNRRRKVFLVEKAIFKGKPLSVRGIQKSIEYDAMKTKVKVSCHHLGHAMAKQMLNADAELAIIQEILGHSMKTLSRGVKLIQSIVSADAKNRAADPFVYQA